MRGVNAISNPGQIAGMEKECREYITTVLLLFALAVAVDNNSRADARVFPPKRYHISPRAKFKDGGGDGVGSFPVARR